MSGWYRMHRGWMDHPVFRDEEFSRRDAFQWMIQEAAFKATQTHGPTGIISLERGQFSHSLRYMAAAWKWSEPKVRRYLKSTQDAKIIDAQTVAGQSVITICNYDKYQVRPTSTDAGGDAGSTQAQNESDAKKKEGNNKEERGGGYAFAGLTIRLTQDHYDGWRARYHAIADINAELGSLDEWLQRQPEEKRKGWFQIVSGALNRKHQELVNKAQVTADGPNQQLRNVFDMADAAERRRARWEEQQRSRPAQEG